MTYIVGAPFTEFDPSNLKSTDRAIQAFFRRWYGIDFPHMSEITEQRIAALESRTGAKLAYSLRCLIWMFAGLEQACANAPDGTVGLFDGLSPGWAPDLFEPLDAVFLLRIGDDEIGYDHYGVRRADLDRADPTIRAWSYDEDHGEWGEAFGRPLAGRRLTGFLLMLLVRHAPGPSVIGSVPDDDRFGFLQAAYDLFEIPYEADGTYIFEGEDTLVALSFWPQIQEYAVEFVHRAGVPVPAALDALLKRAQIAPGSLA